MIACVLTRDGEEHRRKDQTVSLILPISSTSSVREKDVNNKHLRTATNPREQPDATWKKA